MCISHSWRSNSLNDQQCCIYTHTKQCSFNGNVLCYYNPNVLGYKTFYSRAESYIEKLTIWDERKGRLNNSPSSLLEMINLMAGPFWVREDQARPNDVECCINVHGIWIFETNCMNTNALRSQVTSHPLDAHEVCHLKINIKPLFMYKSKTTQ